MSYLARIAACNTLKSLTFPRFIVAGQVYGYVLPSFAAALAQFPQVFQVTPTSVLLETRLTDYQARTAAVMHVMQTLYAQGILDSWVGENYPITHRFGEPAEFEVERAATSYLGIKNFGIHMNGLVNTPEGIQVWVGTRAVDKPLWPGKRDQMVAGGQPVGISLWDNLLKEADEEASIPSELARQAQEVGTIHYQQQSERGLDRSTIFVFDLWLPEDFVPMNQDGEVIGFERISLDKLAQLTENTTDFKDNCNLVNIDLLLRLGHITPQHPSYHSIMTTLYLKDSNDAH